MECNANNNAETEGWAWFDPQAAPPADDNELIQSFTRCFKGPEGQHALRHLQQTILDRRLGPKASDAELRFLEGQRSVVAHIITMVMRGRS